jgi:putative SOS response-associated peptidase YedK
MTAYRFVHAADIHLDSPLRSLALRDPRLAEFVGNTSRQVFSRIVDLCLDVWFALNESRPLACFAGIWTNWTSVRKVKEGETTNDLFAFLTTEPNAEVGAIHPKAMPVILTTPEEVETWMAAPPDEALKLQRPLSDGALRIVARGVKEERRPGPG